MRKANLKEPPVTIDPSGFEQLAFWITALAPLLLLGGIIGAYLEFKIPGASLPGIFAAVCFTLFFLGHYLAGLAGWEVVALFVLGLVLLMIEILFFAHSTVVFGVVGVFLMLASLLWAMTDRYPGQTFLPTGHMLAVPLLNLSLAIVAAWVVIALLARYLPKTSRLSPLRIDEREPARTISLRSSPRIYHARLRYRRGCVALPSRHCARAGRRVLKITSSTSSPKVNSFRQKLRSVLCEADGMRVVVKAVA